MNIVHGCLEKRNYIRFHKKMEAHNAIEVEILYTLDMVIKNVLKVIV